MIYNSTTGSSNTTEDFLKDCKPLNVLPSNCHLDEACYFIIESVEEDYNSLMQDIGIRELNAFIESGSDVVWEAADIAKMKQKVVDFFKQIWEKLKHLYGQFMDQMNRMTKKIKEQLIKLAGGNSAMSKPKRAFLPGKTYATGYDFKGILTTDQHKSKVSGLGFSEAWSSIQKSADNFDKAIVNNKKENTDSTEAINTLSEDIKGAINKVKTTIAASSKVSDSEAKDGGASEIKKWTKQLLRGDDKTVKYDGAWINNNWSSMTKFVCESGMIKKIVKGLYDKDKKTINDAISGSKKVSTEGGLQKCVAGGRELCNIIISCRNAHMSVIGEEFSLFRSIVFKGVVGSKDKAVKTTNESATVTQSDLVASLFNWD